MAASVVVLTALTFLSLSSRATGAVPSPDEFTISISDTPSPSDPFLISFSVTVVPGTPTAFNWSFGDGHFANGTGPPYGAPVHRYIDPGSFLVGVVVWEGNLSGTQALTVTVAPSGLVANIALSPPDGASPFTATFTASISGGTGTYPAVHWSFGDGGAGSGLVIRYTYVAPGNYLALLNVTDSAGASASARVWVNVTAGGSGETSISGWTNALVLAAAAVIGTLTAAAVLGLWLGRRRLAPPDEGVEEGPPPESPTPVPSSPLPVPPTTAPAPSLPPAQESSPAPPAPTAPAVEAPSDPERLRVSQRIVLHLAGLGKLGPDEVASLGFTQLGMSEALGTRQNALTNVLRRLVAASVLEEDTRHVQGQPRRLKVYRLTARGEELARDLRRHRRREGSSTGKP
jgi:hypothetical protein